MRRNSSYFGGIVVDKLTDTPTGVGIHIRLSPAAHQVVEGLRADTGVPNTEAMSRILEYFAGLDRKFRLAIINKDPETRRELARLALREMAAMDAAGEKPPGTVEEACAAIRALVGRIEQTESARQHQLGGKGVTKKRG
jgi:hypothetical protein